MTEFARVGSRECVECPECGFTFDGAHSFSDGTYACPECNHIETNDGLNGPTRQRATSNLIQSEWEARNIMKELDLTFEGRDADGAPSAAGSYWLGHALALRVWYWLHPELLPDAGDDLPF